MNVSKGYRSKSGLSGVLSSFGFSTFLIVFSILMLAFNFLGNIPVLTLVFGIVLFFAMFVRRLRRYQKRKEKEQREKTIDWKDLGWPFVIIVAILAVLIFGLAGIFQFYRFTPDNLIKDVWIVYYTLTLAIFFCALPGIMAVWDRAAPSLAALIVKFQAWYMNVYRYFSRSKEVKKVHKILVLDVSQRSSMTTMMSRAQTGMSFSIFFVVWVIQSILPEQVFRAWLLGITGATDIHPFILDSTYFLGVTVFPIIIETFFLFLVLPGPWLLDDAGVVYFRQSFKKRKPPTMEGIGKWFLSYVKPLVDGGAFFGYIQYIRVKLLPWLGRVQDAADSGNPLEFIPQIQYFILIIAFPILATILVVFLLQLFQESQYNKQKTYLFQELVKINIDPRVTKIIFERTREFQDGTHANIRGEGRHPNPALLETIDKFSDVGVLDLNKNPYPYYKPGETMDTGDAGDGDTGGNAGGPVGINSGSEL